MGNNLGHMEIAWHPGFYGAMEIELMADKGRLGFEREHVLGKEPLRMDLLVIRKHFKTPVQNEIGHIFKKYNVIEYKGPGDGLSIDDYYKAVGYACLYKGLADRVDQIPAKEVTVSIFRESYPRKLFEALQQAGFRVKKKYDGIYYIEGQKLFDTQVVVSSLLKGGKHKSLRLLSTHVREADAREFVKEAVKLTEPGDRNNVEAVLQVSIAANQVLYDKIRRGSEMCDALRNLMKEEIAEEKDRARKEGLEEGRTEGREKGLEEGRAEGREEGRKEGREEGRKEGQETLLEAIKNLMANMKWSAEQAMAAMDIPAEKRTFYKAKL